MTKQSAKDFIHLIQAMVDGHDIEVKDGAGRWSVHEYLKFDQSPEDYRVKQPDPEPPARTCGQVARRAFEECPEMAEASWEAAAQAVLEWNRANEQAKNQAIVDRVMKIEYSTSAEPAWRDLVPGVDRWESGDERSMDGKSWRAVYESSDIGRTLIGVIKGRRKVSAPVEAPWTPPEPPAGREWHKPIKECWDDGCRAPLVGEHFDSGEIQGLFSDGVWITQETADGGVTITEDFDIYRTRKPLPTLEITPPDGFHLATEAELERLPEGSMFCHKEPALETKWWTAEAFIGGQVPRTRTNWYHHACPNPPAERERVAKEWRFDTSPRDHLVWVYKKGFITDRLITAWRDDGVEIGSYAKVTYAELLADWLQRDGSACGEVEL